MVYRPLYWQFGKVTIPQRYILAFMGFLGMLHVYNLRININLVITEIVEPTHLETTNQCPELQEEKLDIKGGMRIWTTQQESLVLNSFYIGYVITHVPAGILADKYGGKHVFSQSVIISAIGALLTPVTVLYGDWPWLSVLRLIQGLSQGGSFPGVVVLLSHWVPKRERTTIGAVVMASIHLSKLTGALATSYIITTFGNWPVSFYFWGGLAIVWYIFFLLMCFSSPKTHPFVTKEEADMLAQQIGHPKGLKTPWKAILRSGPFWAIVVGQLGNNWIHFTILVYLPQYMKYVLKLNINHNALFVSFSFVAFWVCGLISGYVSDVIIRRELMHVLTLRRICSTIGSAGPSICALIAVYSGCNRAAAISMFTLGMFVMGTYYAGVRINVCDLTVNFAGSVTAVVNGSAALAGIICPYIVGLLVKHNSLWEWQMVVWSVFAVATFTNILYITFASGDRQDWDYEATEERKSSDP